MLALTLAQMRRSAGRLAAAGLAIVLGTAFVTATLLSGAAITRTTFDAVAGEYAQADLVASGGLDQTDLAAIEAVPGVGAVQPLTDAGTELVGPKGRSWAGYTGRASDPRLDPAELMDGRLPDADGEIALPDAVAATVGAAVGDQVEAVRYLWPDGATEPETVAEQLTVVGLVAAPSAFLSTGGIAVLTPDQAGEWLTEGSGGDVVWSEAMIALDPGVDVSATTSSIADATGARVTTRDERAAEQAAEVTGSTTVLVAVVLAFAGVALLVAALVIANTFQVLVAQRTRTLALLRCVGADRCQLRRGVLLEATLVGVIASVAGVALGTGLVQGALTVLGRTTDVPVPATVSLSPTAVLVPVAVGTLVTLIASLAPARAATRVSPLAALAPVTVTAHDRAGKVRAGFAIGLTLLGAGLLALGTVVAWSSMPLGLAVGMLGGAISFLGVLVGAVFWVPGLIARLGRLVARGPAGRLAAANAVRNPRRVATTSGALFIGVTLVAMMSTGAASVSRTFTSEIAAFFPVDVVVEALPTGEPAQALPADLVTRLAEVDGIADRATVVAVDELTLAAGTTLTTNVYAGDLDELRSVMVDRATADALRDGAVLLTEWTATDLGVAVGDTLTASGPDGTAELEVASTTASLPILTTATLAGLDRGAPAVGMWLEVAQDADPVAVVAEVQSLVAEADAPVQVVGLAVERAFFERVVDTLLAIVVGLLGVAVVIAVVGVANTLSLSVIERRRESATLRAIGLTRAQLRGTLAVEGLLVAGVGALVGAALGVVYGFLGAHILLAEVSAVALVVPWTDLALVLGVALVAGLAASVLPARSAVRTPPVAALGTE